MMDSSRTRKINLAIGFFSLISCACIASFTAYELSKVKRVLKHLESHCRNVTSCNETLHDKDGHEIAFVKTESYRSAAKVEELLCSLFLISLFLYAFSSSMLLKASLPCRRLLLLPWLATTAFVTSSTVILSVLDTVLYGLSTENIVQLLVLAAYALVQLFSFLHVLRLSLRLSAQALETRLETTLEMRLQTRRSSSSSAFTIAESIDSGTMPTPPPYEEIGTDIPSVYTKPTMAPLADINQWPPAYTP